jgi:organic hydroperoxide reductase OsmC/OhrA
MKLQFPLIYRAEIEWTGERRGLLKADGLPKIDIAPPPEFHGHPGAWSPEQLYVGSILSCFTMTFLAASLRAKLDIESFRVDGEAFLERVEGDGLQITGVIVRPRLLIRSVRDLERAHEILEEAEGNCIISKSIKPRPRLEPQVFHLQEPSYPCPPVVGDSPDAD